MRGVWISAVGLTAVMLAGCAGTSSGADAIPSAAVRGTPVHAFTCTNTAPSGPLRTFAPSRVLLLRVCPAGYPQGQPEVTVHRSDAAFSPLLAALTQPDQAKSTGPCPEYADVLQTVLASTARGPMLVHIPVDGCGHYQRAALDAIAQARGHDAAGPRP